MNTPLIDALNWRYACKKFNPDQRVSEADLATIVRSIQLTPSSYGLQPLKVLIIESKALRAQIKPIAWNQTQVVDASHLIIFCHYTSVNEAYIDTHVELMATTRNMPTEKLAGFGNHVKESIAKMTESQLREWTAKQTYIALGQLLTTCALLKIDATPMEGFDKEELNKLLGLNEKNLSTSLLCPIGYRHEEDPYLQLKKVRRPLDVLIETL